MSPSCLTPSHTLLSHHTEDKTKPKHQSEAMFCRGGPAGFGIACALTAPLHPHSLHTSSASLLAAPLTSYACSCLVAFALVAPPTPKGLPWSLHG